MRQIVAIGVHQFIDPLDTDRSARLRLDGEGGRVMQQQTCGAFRFDRAITPDGGLGKARWQDLLLKLLHGDLVIIDLRVSGLKRPCLWHHRRNEQRRFEFRDRQGVQCAARDLGKYATERAIPCRNKKCSHSGRAYFEKVSSGYHNATSNGNKKEITMVAGGCVAPSSLLCLKQTE